LALPPILRWVGDERRNLEGGDFKINPWKAKLGPRLPFPERPRERVEFSSN